MKDQLAAPDNVQDVHRRFLERRDVIAEKVESCEIDGAEGARRLTEATDRWVQDVWMAASDGLDVDARLIALGGYGRGEMSPGSDVDLVVEVRDDSVFESQAMHTAAERFMAWCREPRVKVAYAVRTREQTYHEFESDYRTAVSYLDARPLAAGASTAWQGCGAAEASAVLRGDDEGVSFVGDLYQGYKSRLERFGRTIYLLEPELKSGKGGLRDLHCIRWAALVRFGFEPAETVEPELGWTADRRDVYREGLRWLLETRFLLHLFHGRKHDRLNFRDQERMARRRFPDAEDLGEATERMMREHYRHARATTTLAERMLRRWGEARTSSERVVGGQWRISGGQIGLTDDCEALSALEVFEALALASEHDLLLHPALETAIEDAVAEWGEDERKSAALNREFLELLTGPDVSERTSHRMLDLGILTKMIPEFEPLVCHVQHDVYHVYTTDVHSLKCLECARSIVSGTSDPAKERWPFFQHVADEIENRRVFLLSALFHDIGKNRGGGHSRKGAAMMAEIGRRLGLESREIDQLGFLVRDHLTLSNTARRHDISDRRIIRDLAAKLKTVETLNQLTVLTFCDMSTVGDDVMNDWNASLLTELHRRLRVAIEHGVENLWQGLADEVERRREALTETLSADPEVDAGELRSHLDEFFRDVPASHLVETPPETLVRQFDVYDSGAVADGVAVRVTPNVERGSTEVLVSTRDVPGALASITGTLSAMGLNILAAQIVTTASGRTLDLFQVALSGGAGHALSPAAQRPLTDRHRIERLERRLVAVLEGEESVEVLLRKRIAESRLAPRPTPAVDASVEVHPELSDDFTVIEIKAPDRIGLLYEIASTLLAFDVNIHLSKIDSLGTQVIDTFYVEDLGGEKLSAEKLSEVVSALERAITNSPLRQF